ncbi:hypothetical protein Q5752_002536 [Cryptotrichosporon argae]
MTSLASEEHPVRPKVEEYYEALETGDHALYLLRDQVEDDAALDRSLKSYLERRFAAHLLILPAVQTIEKQAQQAGNFVKSRLSELAGTEEFPRPHVLQYIFAASDLDAYTPKLQAEDDARLDTWLKSTLEEICTDRFAIQPMPEDMMLQQREKNVDLKEYSAEVSELFANSFREMRKLQNPSNASTSG